MYFVSRNWKDEKMIYFLGGARGDITTEDEKFEIK